MEAYRLQPDLLIDNRYRIISELYRVGGSDFTFLTLDEKLGRKCMIVQSTAYSPDPLKRAEINKRLENETRILISLSHPNLVKAYDYFYHEDICCVVMDYIDGNTLKDIVNGFEGFLPENNVLEWSVQVCDALEYLHSQVPQIIHSNIKPSSIILEKNSSKKIKLMNLTSARFYNPGIRDEVLWGTEGYSPPEQYRGLTNTQSDIYSLGVTLHHLLTRIDPRFEPPFTLEELQVQKINPGVSQLTSNIIHIATQHNPNDRYQTIGEMKKAIEVALNPSRALKVFLCYSSTDKELVRKLYNRLKSEYNVDPWLDEKKLIPGQDWDLEIEKAIRESDTVIVCLSRDTINKEGYVQKEIVRTLDIANEKPEGTIYVVPLKLEECSIPKRLSRWQWVNYFEQDGHRLLIQALRLRASKLGVSM